MAVRQRAGSVSLIGPRSVNEDSLHIVDHSRVSGRVTAVLAVADGMGGLSQGDVASRTAVEVVTAQGAESLQAEDLLARIALAEERINEIAAESGGVMGTTLTSAVVRDGEATVAHIGDSRAYVVHHGVISLITEDHSHVGRLVREGVLTPEQAMHHPEQNVLERALGAGEGTPDVYRVGLGPGDILFLCTDGLHTFVTPEEMRTEFERNASLQTACERLARLAEQRGSDDNITAVAWEYPDAHAEDLTPAAPRHRSDTVVHRAPGWEGLQTADWKRPAEGARRSGPPVPVLTAGFAALFLGGFLIGERLSGVVG